MKPVPVTIYDGTNTTTVNRINAPAGSVDPNGVLDLGLGVKVYRALLTQTNTDAPVATVLENTLGGDVVWTYNAEGTYIGTLADAFSTSTVVQCSGVIIHAGILYGFIGSEQIDMTATYPQKEIVEHNGEIIEVEYKGKCQRFIE